MKTVSLIARIFRPLQSRKVRIALTTVIAAYLAEYGLQVSEQVMLSILGTGIALILGVAHEDAGRLSSGIVKGSRND